MDEELSKWRICQINDGSWYAHRLKTSPQLALRGDGEEEAFQLVRDWIAQHASAE